MAHLDDDDDEIIRGMLEADESGPPDNPEEQQRRQRAYEEQMIYEESKARFLHDQLKQDLIEGNPRKRLIKEAYYFFIFMIIFSLYVMLTKIDNNTLQLNEGFQRVLDMPMPQKFNRGPTPIAALDTVEDVFNWLAYVLYPVLCTENGIDHWGHLNFYNKVMYGVRLRQIRVKSKSCSMHVGGLERQTFYQMECFQPYEADAEETATLHVGGTNYTWMSASTLKNEILTSWASPSPTLRASFSENLYPGSGYIHDFPLTERSCNAESSNGIHTPSPAGTTLQEQFLALYSSGWVDEMTRALIIEFSTYNPNVGKVLTVQILCERTVSGQTKCNPRTNVYKIFQFQWEPLSMFTFVIAVCIMLYTVKFTIDEVLQAFHPNLMKELRHKEEVSDTITMDAGVEEEREIPFAWRPLYWLMKFEDMWEVIHVGNILTFLFAHYIQVMWYLCPEVWNFKVSNCFDSYVNMAPFAEYRRFQQQLTFGNVLFSFFKCFKFMRLSTSLNVLWLTLSRAASSLVGFLVMVFLIFSGFSLMGYVVFGHQVRAFYSYPAAASTLFQMLLGDFDLQELEEVETTLAWCFFYLYMVLVFLTLINMFIAILQDSYTDVSTTMANIEQPAAVMTWLQILVGQWAQDYYDHYHHEYETMRKQKKLEATKAAVGGEATEKEKGGENGEGQGTEIEMEEAPGGRGGGAPGGARGVG